jgi:hypothetical protein
MKLADCIFFLLAGSLQKLKLPERKRNFVEILVFHSAETISFNSISASLS